MTAFLRKEASPIELAALLMDVVCGIEEKEKEALRRLSEHLGIKHERLQTELIFLKAFAVDFATAMALGKAPEGKAILERCYQHWSQIDEQTGSEGALVRDLQVRFQGYSEAVGDSETDAAGLKGAIGKRFAQYCGEPEQKGDLAMLGGEMFGALFDEVVDLLQETHIVLYGISERGVEE